MERGGFNLLTFADQKEKPIPANWPVDFVAYQGKNSTLDIINDPRVKEIKEKIGARLAYVFKNNFLIEKAMAELGLSPLNPAADLIEKIEGKVSQTNFLPELKEYFPEFIITQSNAISFAELKKELGEKMVAQFNTSHSGAGTFLLTENLWSEWQEKFPQRPIRVSRFVTGKTITINLVVLPTAVIVGAPSWQLTGLADLTEHQFTTVGNAWITFDLAIKNQVETIAQNVGAVLQKNNFFGPAGLDLIFDELSEKLYLIEINARQPASFNLESWLQKLGGQKGLFDYLADFWQGKILPRAFEPVVIAGGQVVVRAKSDWCGIIKSTPKTGVYGLDNGQLVLTAEKPFLSAKNEFLAHFCPISRRVLAGDEVFRVQTGKNFVINGNLSDEINIIIGGLKSQVSFDK